MSDIDISIVDSMSLSEGVWTSPTTRTAYELLVVVDYPTLLIPIPFASGQMYSPVARMLSTDATSDMSSKFARAFTSDPNGLKTAGAVGLGYFGALLNTKAATPALSGTLTQNSFGLSLNEIAPTASGEGFFGGSVNVVSPVPQLEAGFNLGGTFSLASYSPTWSLSASFDQPRTFSLNRQAPAWIGTGTLTETQPGMVLASRSSASKLLASMYEEGGFNLDGIAPVCGIESTMYSGGFYLNAYAPAAVMVNNTLVYKTRFSDYILRYVRS